MLSEEEKKAIERLSLKAITSSIETPDYPNAIVMKKDLITLFNLIEKQSKEIEHQKEKRENQKKELAILNEKQKEFNKLVNTVKSYKGQFKRQEKENTVLRQGLEENTKEIEELKEENTANLAYYDQIYQSGIYTGQRAVENKIKTKIEEIDIEIQCCEYADDDTEEYKQDIEKEKRRLLRDKAVLQSLLEKE